ncbi:MAG: permease-like cell division protein FtsX [Actinobacteria bacterium]|nr:permease-like cell division protein FtsX [Actinomycetota bacterium]
MRIAAVGVAVFVMAACGPDSTTDADASRKECEATVHVFLELDANEQRQRLIGQVISDAPSVLRSKFHSSLEAYREFKTLYKEHPKIYEAKRPSDFPARYEVTLVSNQSFDVFERTLAGVTTGIDRLVPGGCASPEPT